MKIISIKDLLDAGIHLVIEPIDGTLKCQNLFLVIVMAFTLIDLQQTLTFFNNALKVVEDFAKEGKNILFIGTKRQASDIIEKYAVDCNQFFINKRWLGGMFTNWDTIQNSTKKLKD